MNNKNRTKEQLINELVELKAKIAHLEKSENERVIMESGITEVLEVLKKISAGDPSVRVAETSNSELIARLKQQVNATAEEIGILVDQSHEFAINLAEHFDVLNRVSKRDLNARVLGESCNELSESLKKVTNDMIESISRAEEALKESEEKYGSLFKNSNDAILLYDLEGNIIDFNQKVLDQFRYDKSEIASLKISDLHVTEDLEASERAFKKLLGDAFVNCEINFKSKDGEVFPAEVSSSLFEIGGKKVIQSIVRDITHRKRAVDQIVYMAYHDTLTKLPNRLLLKDRLKQALASAKQYNRLVATLFLDLDNFKHTNDTLGHDVGDLLLQEVSDRLVKYIRESDSIARVDNIDIETTVARLGGDEFTILLTEIRDAQDAARVAQRILELFKQPFNIKKHKIFITTSIGISLYPYDGDDVDTMLKNADTAMYHAKNLGRNNYQFYKQSMNVAILQRFDLENKLRRALEQREFELYYQPQVEICSSHVVGMEALIRWMHPELGILRPSTFLHLAEETGLIIPISEWMLYQACSRNRAWQNAGFPPVRVAVNISGIHFRQKNFIETVQKILQDTDLEPQYLELELTEKILMQEAEMVMHTLKSLKSLGIRFSIDHFGTGYSSLSYLKRFSADSLKIDRSFVKDLIMHPDDNSLIKAIIALARNLNMKVVAEGVETEQQLAFLSEQGTGVAQGSLFCPPLPADSLTNILQEGKCSFTAV
jgi:diguanylate cyclase (GGDEF)-like protein/PAS domain S-box-containing protein